MIILGIHEGPGTQYFNVEIDRPDSVQTDFTNGIVTVFLTNATTIDITTENVETEIITHYDVIDVDFVSRNPEHYGKSLTFVEVKSMEIVDLMC